MTLTKSDQFCDPPPTPTFAKMNDRSIVCNGMAKHVTGFKTCPTNADIFFFLYVYVGGKIVIKWKSTVFFLKIVVFEKSTLSGVRGNFSLSFLCTKELKATTRAVR